MLKEEALWLGAQLCRWPTHLGVVLNVGSSSGHFRRDVQPWIEQRVLAPARAHGLRIVHQDLFPAEGVDIAGDLLSDECQERVGRLGVFGVVCSNVLEHVPDRSAFAAALTRLLPFGGRALITVPHRFPYHPDPIDTLYRPTPDELRALFPELSCVSAQLVPCGRLHNLVLDNPRRLKREESDGRAPPPRKLGDWLPYTVRRFKMACVELERAR